MGIGGGRGVRLAEYKCSEGAGGNSNRDSLFLTTPPHVKYISMFSGHSQFITPAPYLLFYGIDFIAIHCPFPNRFTLAWRTADFHNGRLRLDYFFISCHKEQWTK